MSPVPAPKGDLQHEVASLALENAELRRRLAAYEKAQPLGGQLRSRRPSLQHPVHDLVGHKDGVWDVSASRWDPRLLASCSADGKVLLWDAPAAKLLCAYSGHKGSVNSVRFHPTLPFLVTASGDRSVHLVSTTPSAPSEDPSAAAGPPDPSQAAESRTRARSHSSPQIPADVLAQLSSNPSEPGSARTQQRPALPALSSVLEFRGFASHVCAADWVCSGAADRDLIATAGWTGVLRLFAISGGQAQEVSTWQAHEAMATNVTAHPTAPVFASSSKDGLFKLWDARTAKVTATIDAHSGALASALFSPTNGDIIATAGAESLSIWDIRAPKAPTETVSSSHSANRLCFAPSGLLIACPRDDGHTRCYNLRGDVVTELDSRRGNTASLGDKEKERDAIAIVVGPAPAAPSTSVRSAPLRLLSASAWTADERFVFSGGWAMTVFGWKQ